MTTPKRKQPRVSFKQIRQWLVELREYKNLSYKDLADLSGYSEHYVRGVEEGKIELTIPNLFILLDAMDCDLLLRRRQPQRKLFMDVDSSPTGKEKKNGRRK